MLQGKIRSLNADKGFGFIQPTAGGPDLFFHCSTVDADFKALKLDLAVAYEIDPSAEKPRAKQVITGLAAKHPKPPQASAKTPRPDATNQRRQRAEIEYSFGYITKLPRPKKRGSLARGPKTIDPKTNELVPKTPFGFISSVTGGREYYFEPDFVKGKKFDTLKVGDYVRFIPKPNPDNPKEPHAKAVEVVAKPINRQENNLKRHPKARRKKPTWKSR